MLSTAQKRGSRCGSIVGKVISLLPDDQELQGNGLKLHQVGGSGWTGSSWKNFFPDKIFRYRNGLLRVVVKSPFLDVFKK